MSFSQQQGLRFPQRPIAGHALGQSLSSISTLSSAGSSTGGSPVASRRGMEKTLPQGVGSTSGKAVAGVDDLKHIIAEKEQELQAINEFRLRSLEETLQGKESEILAYKEKLEQVKKDFEYNLQLIQDRDEDLQRYEKAFEEVKGAIRSKEMEIGGLRIQISDLEAQIKSQNDNMSAIEARHKEKLKHVKETMTAMQEAMAQQHLLELKVVEDSKKGLEKRIRDKDEELEQQRQELTAAFDSVSKQKHDAHRTRLENMQETIRQLESKLASRSTEELKFQGFVKDLELKIEERDDEVSSLKKDLESSRKESENIKRENDARILKLKQEKASVESVKQSILQEYEAKMTELLGSLHAVQKSYEKQMSQREDEVQHETVLQSSEMQLRSSDYETRLRLVTEKLDAAEKELETARIDLGKTKWNYEEQLAQKDIEIKRLKDDLEQTEPISEEFRKRDMKMKDLENQLAVKEKAEREAQKRFNILQEERDDALEKLRKLETDFKTAKAAHLEAVGKRETEIMANHSEVVTSLQAQRDRLRAESKEQETKIFELENTIMELRAQVAGLEAEMKSLWGNQENKQKPMFEGDFGPASPLGSESPSSIVDDHKKDFSIAVEKGKSREELARLLAVNEKLQEEKKMLSAALKDMRKEMEALIAASNEQSESEKADPKELRLLRDQAKQLQEYVEVLQIAERNILGEDRLVECRVLRELTKTQAKQIEYLREKKKNNESGDFEEEVEIRVEERLKSMKMKLERVVDERDRLADLTNKLRADLKRTPGGAPSIAQLEQVEKQVAATFHTKVKSVELALEQIVSQNRQLKRELRAERQKQLQQGPEEEIDVEPKSSSLDVVGSAAERKPRSAKGKSGASASTNGEAHRKRQQQQRLSKHMTTIKGFKIRNYSMKD